MVNRRKETAVPFSQGKRISDLFQSLLRMVSSSHRNRLFLCSDGTRPLLSGHHDEDRLASTTSAAEYRASGTFTRKSYLLKNMEIRSSDEESSSSDDESSHGSLNNECDVESTDYVVLPLDVAEAALKN